MENKGQTALEYLITYGWAILVILVVLAVLWYYGIFNPATWAGEQVISGSAFQITDKSLGSTTLTLVLGNKVGSRVNITSTALSNGLSGTNSSAFVLDPNGQATIVIPTTATSGSSANFRVTFTYTNLQSGLTGKTDIADFRNVRVS